VGHFNWPLTPEEDTLRTDKRQQSAPKVGAVIIRNTRRIRVLMSDSYPYKDELTNLVRRLIPE